MTATMITPSTTAAMKNVVAVAVQPRNVRFGPVPLFRWGIGEIEGVVADRVDPDRILADRCAPAGSWLTHRSLLSFLFGYPQGAT